MSDPLTLTFEFACSVEHAFDTWTSRIDSWWPRDHTVSAEAGLTVVLEREVGGRIFERTSAGAEYDWGEVTVWEPPKRLSYTWHLGTDPAEATEVDIRFRPIGDIVTRVEIEHRGWDRLGAAAADRRRRNQAGWNSLLPYYLAAVDALPGTAPEPSPLERN
ncbi:MAG: hypothetical protein QOE53_1823 [Pseudonocardiales bacterium]|nr:hypothetical protein [Pseudonocardiales bacterium]